VTAKKIPAAWKKPAVKKPAVKKPAMKKALPNLYIMIGNDCISRELFHPHANAPATARSEGASVYGPYHTLEDVIKDQDGMSFDLDDYSKSSPMILYVKQGDSFKRVSLISERKITIL
jgi:S-formylglutathione hydrolase FrmB